MGAGTVRIMDNNDGTYTGMYVTQIRGIFQLYVSLGGTEVPDSPFEVGSSHVMMNFSLALT